MSGYNWDIDRVYNLIKKIAEEIPDRLPGTSSAQRMAQLSCEELNHVGVQAKVQPVHALVSNPKPAILKVLEPVQRDIKALTMAHSQLTKRPIVAELIDVGLGGFEDYKDIDANGKLTLSELSYAPPRQEKQRIAGLQGSSAQIMMNWGYSESEELPMGSVKSGWGNPTRDTENMSEASLPCVGISRKDGEWLRELCAKGLVTVSLETDADTGWRDIHVTVGDIQGSQSEDFALVGGHQDSWFGGAATDNASGSAIIIELARVFAENATDLRRGLSFGFWAGHETGTMAGSSWYAEKNWDRLRDHAVGYLQIDQPACTGTYGWTATSNPEMYELAKQVNRSYGDEADFSWSPQVKNGDASFFGIGVPMLVAHSRFPAEELKRTSNAAYGWWHHTDKNEIDKIDKSLLEKHLNIYAEYLRRLTMDPVLPLRFSKVGAVLMKRLKELQSESGSRDIDLNNLTARASALSRKLVELDSHANRLSAAGNPHEKSILRMNSTLRKLSRLFIPVLSTVVGKYGHDPYGLTAQTTFLPGLYGLADYAAVNSRPEKEMRWVELMRSRNQISDALAEAGDLCDRYTG